MIRTFKTFLYDGSLMMNNKLNSSIWNRDQFFKWLSSLMEFENNLFEKDTIEDFFLKNILKLDPKLLTLSGILLFKQFFRPTNVKK